MKDTVSHYVPPHSPLTSTEPQVFSNNLTMPSTPTTSCGASRKPSGCPSTTCRPARSTTAPATPSKPTMSVVFAAMAVSTGSSTKLNGASRNSYGPHVATAPCDEGRTTDPHRCRPFTRRPRRSPRQVIKQPPCALIWPKSGFMPLIPMRGRRLRCGGAARTVFIG